MQALWILYIAFICRVGGQLAVSSGLAPWLPPFEEWHSGLLPYPVLLTAQLLIIAFFGKICLDLTLQRGYFSQPHPKLGASFHKFGWVYLAAMILRYVVRMALMPDERWFGGCIPIVFHWVLASYILILAAKLRSSSAATGHKSDQPYASTAH